MNHFIDEIQNQFFDLDISIVLDQYSKDENKYHTLSHIDYCLKEVSQTFCKLNVFDTPVSSLQFEAIKLAILFHDAIYDPQKTDNEEKSVEFFNQFCNKTKQVKSEIVNLVKPAILATKSHKLPNSVDQYNSNSVVNAITVMADLSVFYMTTYHFDLYDDQIRNEYSFVHEKIFKSARKTILNTFLQEAKNNTLFKFCKKNSFHRKLNRMAFDNCERILKERYSV